MKKTFQLMHPTKRYDRMIEAVRAEINKYLKRERGKKLPKGVDFWDFDCKFGSTEEDAKIVHVADIGKSIGEAEEKQMESVYIEILAKPAKRMKKQKKEVLEKNDFESSSEE